MPLGMEVGLSPGDFVLDGDPAPSPKGAVTPKFLAHVYCGQTAAWIKKPLGTEVCLSLRDIVLDGDPAPPPLKGHSPQFSVNVRCGQMAGWTEIPLSMEVGLGPDDFVFDGDAATSRKKALPHSHPIFDPRLLWPNCRMDEDSTWYGSRPRLRPYCIKRGPSSPRKGHNSTPYFRAMFIVATVAHLSYC